MSEAGTEPEARDRRLVAERRALPDEPGVYLFRDGGDEVIYVGKARSIRKRVASHFSGGNPGMTSEIESIECLVTETESEALIAEQNFIKRYRPRFNVRLRDDKSYPYIGVSLDEDFPRVYFTRERHRPGRAYFGPFSSARRVRETLDLLGRLFQFRTCDGPQPGRRSGSPCLDYYIERCGAPCVGYVDQETYRGSIDGVLDFLSGRYGKIEGELESQMEEASAAQDFERAATLRDRLASVRSLFERQRVSGTPVGSADLIGVATDGGDANAQVFQVRDGVLLERQGFYLDVPEGAEQGEVAAGFLERFYATSPAMPRTVLVGPELAERTDELAERLADRRDGPPVDLRVAERGEMRRLREMAERNARLALGQEQLRREYGRRRKAEALSGLAEALGMQEVPVRIEGFDISNLGGQDTVASMVVFEGGSPKKSDYRRFKVDGRTGPDDYASLGEVLARRMASSRSRPTSRPTIPNATRASLPCRA